MTIFVFCPTCKRQTWLNPENPLPTINDLVPHVNAEGVLCSHPGLPGSGVIYCRKCDGNHAADFHAQNVCENGDHPAPVGQRFCSPGCQSEDAFAIKVKP